MDPLLNDLQTLIKARDERMESAGLIPAPREHRSSLEIMRDIRRRRTQDLRAA